MSYENQADFMRDITPHAQRVGAQLGIDPRLIIAQAIQETGWGKKVKGNNYFGIKSHGKKGGQTIDTHEIINGKKVKIKDNFRTYKDIGESVEDYGNFLVSNPRYDSVLKAKDLPTQINAINNSGYATDPNYGSALSNIIKGKTFTKNYSNPIVDTEEVIQQDMNQQSVPQPKSFNQAFGEARQQQGSGGTFEWNGNSYSTNMADEVPAVAEPMFPREEFVPTVPPRVTSTADSRINVPPFEGLEIPELEFNNGTNSVPGYNRGTVMIDPNDPDKLLAREALYNVNRFQDSLAQPVPQGNNNVNTPKEFVPQAQPGQQVQGGFGVPIPTEFSGGYKVEGNNTPKEFVPQAQLGQQVQGGFGVPIPTEFSGGYKV
jgi:hypothetical protein